MGVSPRRMPRPGRARRSAHPSRWGILLDRVNRQRAERAGKMPMIGHREASSGRPDDGPAEIGAVTHDDKWSEGARWGGGNATNRRETPSEEQDSGGHTPGEQGRQSRKRLHHPAHQQRRPQLRSTQRTHRPLREADFNEGPASPLRPAPGRGVISTPPANPLSKSRADFGSRRKKIIRIHETAKTEAFLPFGRCERGQRTHARTFW